MNITENITDLSSVAGSHLSIYSMIHSADTVSKIVMLTLFIASIWSWAIIFSKLFLLRHVKQKTSQFESNFWSGQALDQLFEAAKRNIDNPLSAIFVNAMNECTRKSSKSLADPLLKSSLKDRILQSMNLVKDREINKLEKNLSIITIIGSNALFVGLFGMIWGIMHSFQSIAGSKNTSLAVIAPGISEALLTTAIGLFAAVPCVVFYTYISSKINDIYAQSDDFIGELNNILSRAIDEENL